MRAHSGHVVNNCKKSSYNWRQATISHFNLRGHIQHPDHKEIRHGKQKVVYRRFLGKQIYIIYSEMVDKSPEVLHEEMTSKQCFLEELSLPNIYYLCHLGNLSQIISFGLLFKKKKFKTKPYSSYSSHIHPYTHECLLPCNSKLITRF